MRTRLGNWCFSTAFEAQFTASAILFETAEALARHCGIALDRAEELVRVYGPTVAAIPLASDVHADTSKRVAPLTDLREIRLPSVGPNPTPPSAVLSLQIVTSEGQPFPNVIVDVDSDGRSGQADSSGCVEIPVSHESTCSVAFTLGQWPTWDRDLPPYYTGTVHIERARPSALINAEIPTVRKTVVVQRPECSIIDIHGWREGGMVLLFGTVDETDKGPVTVRGALATFFLHNQKNANHVLWAGHTDAKGGETNNQEIAAQRAWSVSSYVTGAREMWANHAFAQATTVDFQLALRWCSENFGLPDPGPIDGDWGPLTETARCMLLASRNLPWPAVYGLNEWLAIYDYYDMSLCELLGSRTLDEFRNNVYTYGQAEFGELWPLDEVELDGHDTTWNRRVSLVTTEGRAFDLMQGGADGADEIYNGTFKRNYLPIPPEVDVNVLVLDESRTRPIPYANVVLCIENRTINEMADATGVVTVRTLEGMRIQVRDAKYFEGNGHMISRGLPEQLIPWKGIIP